MSLKISNDKISFSYNTPPNIAPLDLGSAITDIFAFLAPADQHKLRRTSSAMCEWFDSAAENGSLAFFVTFAPSVSSAGPLRWKHATANPRGAGPKQEGSNADNCIQATVTVHFRNYCLSTFNVQAGGEAADDAIIDKAEVGLVADFAIEYKLVVTGLFGILSIGDGFCGSLKAVEVEFKGEGSLLRSVGRRWMSDCLKMRRVTFAGFGMLEDVGFFWMYNCASLESITFASDMPNLKRVGDCWMSRCENLKHVDLTGVAAPEEVGNWWLSNCSSLESVTFASMPKLKKIGNSCMSMCSKLKHVDLAGLTSLEEVGNYWLYNCSRLESIAFVGDNLKRVGESWMSRCSNLKRVDLTGFSALEEVGDSWMCECSSLESITFASDMPKLKKVGYCWMSGCSKLKHVGLVGLTSLEAIGEHWLSHCPCLERVMLPAGMPKLKQVSHNWTPQSGRQLSDHLPNLSK